MSINTIGVNYDSNPALWLSDARVQQHLPRQHTLDFVNLLHYAMKLHATTGSDYVDGEFSYSAALVMVPGLTPEAFDAIEAAHLVSQIDGDRWAVDFITQQTSHEALQNSADGKARAGKTRQQNFAAAKEAERTAEERAQRKREQDAARKRKQREREATDERQDEPEADTGYSAPKGVIVHATADEYLPNLCEDCAEHGHACGNVDLPHWARDTAHDPRPKPICPECVTEVEQGAPRVNGDEGTYHMRCYTVVYERQNELVGV